MNGKQCKAALIYSFKSRCGRSALEAAGHVLAAVVKDEAEVDGEVEVDAEHVGLDGGAEADCGLEVDEALEEGAARQRGRRANLGLDQAQHVGAHAQLQRVDGALADRPRRGGCRGGRGRPGRAVGRVARAGHAQHQVHGHEQHERLGRH